MSGASVTTEVIQAYHDGDPNAAAVLQMRGAELVPGLRLQDCATAAIMRHLITYGPDLAESDWTEYVAQLHRENRVARKERV